MCRSSQTSASIDNRLKGPVRKEDQTADLAIQDRRTVLLSLRPQTLQ